MKGTPMSEASYDYVCSLFSSEDEFLRRLNAEAEEAGIPPIHISIEQLAFLQVLLRSINARNILEIGSLAGYSAIGMARALPEDGKVICLEIEPQSVQFIRRKAEEAGMSHKIDVLQGDAATLLTNYQPASTFDFIFIDADKPRYKQYMELTLPLLRQGGIIAGDNALAWGKIADTNTDEPDVQGMQEFNKALSVSEELQACMVPVGDGMAMGVKL